MLKRIGQVIMNNFGLKVLAAILAIILWLAIVNVADPDMSATYTIPITIVNDEHLAEEGLIYEILDNTGEITFTVEGPRSYVEDLTEEDFSATADLEKVDSSVTAVDIKLSVDKYSNRVELTSPQSELLLQVEERVTKEFDIAVVPDGTTAADCYVESAQAEPSVVSVTGPQSAVDEVASAQAVVSVDGAEEDFTSREPVVLLDENGAELDENSLTVDVAETEVSVRIFMQKTVPLRFAESGEPAEGCWAGAPECDVESVVITGEESTIREIDEIVIDTERLDVTGAEQDITVRLTLSNYLPDGVTLAEEGSDSIEVTIPIVPAYTREVELSTGNITVENLADGLSLTIRGDSVPVQIVGPEDVVGSVNANRLEGTIDAAGYDAGSYNLAVDVDTEGAFDAEATASVTIAQEE